MSDIAVRLETQGGTYTNFPGETSGVFDVRAVSAIYEPENIGFDQAEQRPVITSNVGVSTFIQGYERDLGDAPDDYTFLRLSNGMYADNPSSLEQVATEVIELLGVDRNKKVVTFIGTDAVEAAFAQLLQLDGRRAAYVTSIFALAVNHARASAPRES